MFSNILIHFRAHQLVTCIAIIIFENQSEEIYESFKENQGILMPVLSSVSIANCNAA